MSRIAIFGGSFNPPHLGHQALCLMLLETCPVDEVWVLPTYRHFFGKDLAPFDDRVALCECMVAPLGDRARVCLAERQLASPQGRMLDALEYLQAQHAEHQWRLVIGADILQETHRWHAWEKVVALAPPLVFSRHGYPGGDLPAPPEVSSTEIRQRLAAGSSAVPLVPLRVQAKIDSLELYRP